MREKIQPDTVMSGSGLTAEQVENLREIHTKTRGRGLEIEKAGDEFVVDAAKDMLAKNKEKGLERGRKEKKRSGKKKKK